MARRAGARSTGARLTLAAGLVVLLVLAGVGVVGVVGVVGDLVSGRGECTLRSGEAVEELTAEQAANAATIAQVALQRDLPPRAVTIAITTAIQESGLRNLDYGDRDSLGLFQQRPSQEWGTEDQVRDPVYASGAFFDELVTIPDWQTGSVNDVAQAVQRSGFPEAYADHEGEGRVIASVLVGESAGALGLACDLDVEDLPVADGRSLLDKIDRQLDLPASTGFDDAGRPAVLIEAGSAGRAHSVAVWALAHAPYEGIEQVRVGDRVWRVGTDRELPWPEGPADDAADAELVVLTLHR